MQALMLAAGMGKRLGKYTADNTKCMLKINDKTLIERATEALLDAGINKMILVLGYKGDNVKKYLLEECSNPRIKEMEYVFIDNDVFDKTNNIYSLYLAKDELAKDDTILLESDLIYDYDLIKRLVASKEKNLVSVTKYTQWMDGTVIRVDDDNNILEFIEKKKFSFEEIDDYYKTVNVYKFSKEFINKEFISFLDAYIKAYGENEYYELVLKIIAHLSRSSLKALDVSDIKWYEIDDGQDLDIVNCIFTSGKEKLENFQKRYGGYWRFDNLLDYCYLVNPYYPPKNMLNKINYFSRDLITQYPSGQAIECINAGRLFNDTDEKYFAVGNGAAELINILGKNLHGKMLISKTSFNEYYRCFNNMTFDIFDMSKNNYAFDINLINKKIEEDDIICLVNPDNPTGAFIDKSSIIKILNKAKSLNKQVIFDESFIDFVDKDQRYTLINNDDLEEYPNLVVVKSISKSYGIPGLRLGIVATSNQELLSTIKQDLAVWNINSYAEYFLQIAPLYKKDYTNSCDRIAEERKVFTENLRSISNLEVYDSQANFLLCKLANIDSTEVTMKLLEDDIFIKDLKTKESFKDLDFVRLAVRSEEDNRKLVKCLKEIMK